MISIQQLINEAVSKPKAIVMAGGAGAGKSYLLNQLGLSSLPLHNPDKYVEDPDHPAYNKLSTAVAQLNKDVAADVDSKRSFVWDTTASNPKKVKELIDAGYDVYMVMVYTHPMISYISNFSRQRNIPGSAVFSTWRNVYQLIEQYNKMLGGNLSIFVNDRGGKFDKEIKEFDTAAKNGAAGIKDYLEKYNAKHNIGGSTFFEPVEMSQQEEEEFNRAIKGIDYDKGNRSEDKAVKKEFLKHYNKNGVAPGADVLRKAIQKYRDGKVKSDQRNSDVLNNIADMIYNPTFQELLKHSSPAEIDQNVQNFLR